MVISIPTNETYSIAFGSSSSLAINKRSASSEFILIGCEISMHGVNVEHKSRGKFTHCDLQILFLIGAA